MVSFTDCRCCCCHCCRCATALRLRCLWASYLKQFKLQADSKSKIRAQEKELPENQICITSSRSRIVIPVFSFTLYAMVCSSFSFIVSFFFFEEKNFRWTAKEEIKLNIEQTERSNKNGSKNKRKKCEQEIVLYHLK